MPERAKVEVNRHSSEMAQSVRALGEIPWHPPHFEKFDPIKRTINTALWNRS